MKKWLVERRELFQTRDSIGAEIVPKGVLLMGISGCGKSLSVKAIATVLRAAALPHRHGRGLLRPPRHAGAAFAQACRTMEEIAPAVVWFDEIETGHPSAPTAGEQGRIFAFFLTWMQEKPRGLFVAATANRIDLLPAEMIRKGRFDEVFFVDLPHDDERLEIFKIHLQRRGVDPSDSASSGCRHDRGLDRRRDRAVRRLGASPARSSPDHALTFDDLLRSRGAGLCRCRRR